MWLVFRHRCMWLAFRHMPQNYFAHCRCKLPAYTLFVQPTAGGQKSRKAASLLVAFLDFCPLQIYTSIYFWNTIGGRSKQIYGSLGKTCAVQLAWGQKRQTLSLPPTCTQLVLCEKGKFSLDGSFSKNAPYKQKIIFHLTSIGKMSRNFFFFLGR